MHHNILNYWQHLETLAPGDPDLPNPRVCRLMTRMFEFWRSRQPFPRFGYFGHLRDHFGPAVLAEPVPVRRGHAMAKSLQMVSCPQARKDGLMRVHPDELVVGTMPPFSVGQGKEVMEYLLGEQDGGHDEALAAEIGFLNAWSNFGHICPDHEKVLREGLTSIIADCAARRAETGDAGQQAFYHSVEVALAGVIAFAAGYADACEELARQCEARLAADPESLQRDLLQERIKGMTDAASRLRRIPAEGCESFLDAVQCIFLMNCALHWTGELSSLGRLDQILQPYLDADLAADRLTLDQAQEIIDCLWVKLDERVVLDHRHIDDHFTSADGALMGAGGPSNFDQGALINQWMQQVTLGGVIADNDPEPKDACNQVTRLCLNAARKFPFNCPTVDLRVHKGTPRDVLELAGRAILSGGAHPILMNDDKIIPGLHASHPAVDLRTARNYACDGCYETHFPGETEFSFYYVPGVDALEKALNSGAGFGASGTTFLRGMKSSWRTPKAGEIGSFEELYAIFERHVALSSHRGIGGLLAAYGAKGKVCPSPILSAMIAGCIDKGRDFYDGGARHHVFAPLMTGISTVADSLHVIRELVFGQQKFTLEELVACLRSDWGGRPVTVGRQLAPARVDEIRNLCLAQNRFGHGHAEVDALAWRVIHTFCDAQERALQYPMHRAALASLEERFGSDAGAFTIAFTPGVGTFEQYAFGGGFAGATPDGRRAGQPVASDLSASPLPQDLAPLDSETGQPVLRVPFAGSLSSWDDEAVNRLSDGAPADINIAEDFPAEELLDIIARFAGGEGSNMMTMTCASPAVFAEAETDPLAFDLLRVRMGGWTEFFSVLFPEHKRQHRRRPLYVPTGDAR
jgi:pyruvate-formate lyase